MTTLAPIFTKVKERANEKAKAKTLAEHIAEPQYACFAYAPKVQNLQPLRALIPNSDGEGMY